MLRMGVIKGEILPEEKSLLEEFKKAQMFVTEEVHQRCLRSVHWSQEDLNRGYKVGHVHIQNGPDDTQNSVAASLKLDELFHPDSTIHVTKIDLEKTESIE